MIALRNPRAMPSSKPRNAVCKDTVVAYLALKAHFAIADSHPKEENMTELGKLMLLHVPHPISPEIESWKGKYYYASKLLVLGAHVALENALKNHGLPSQEYKAEQDKRDCALRDLQIAKDEEPAEYDAAWYPTLWKAYIEATWARWLSVSQTESPRHHTPLSVAVECDESGNENRKSQMADLSSH